MNSKYNNFGKYNKNRLIETLLNIGGKDIKTTLDSTKVEKLAETTKNITNDMLVKGMTNLLTVAFNEASQSSKADIVKALQLSNTLNLSGLSTDGGLVLSGIEQTTAVDSSTDVAAVQSLQSKITSDLTTNVSKIISQKLSNIDEIKNSVQSGTQVGDIVTGAIDTAGSIGNNFIDTSGELIGGVLSANIGGTKEERSEKRRELSETTRDNFNLTNPLEIEESEDISNDVKNLLSQDNLANCAERIKSDNNIDVSGAELKKDAIITDIKQTAIVSSVFKCSFNQTAMSEMATKIVANIEKTLEQISETVFNNESEEKSGDILAAGEAGKAILVGAGEGVAKAAEGAGEGISTASKGLGEGVSTAADGVGKGVSSIATSLMWPLIIFGVVAALGLLIYLMMKMGGSSEDYGDYDYDYDY